MSFLNLMIEESDEFNVYDGISPKVFIENSSLHLIILN